MKTATDVCQPLPPYFISSIESIRWPLDPSQHPGLQLKSLREMEAFSRPAHLDPSHPLATRQLRRTLEDLFGHNNESSQFGIIATSLILLGHGLVDEAHSIITPFSWPTEIHFNHGPVQYHRVSKSVQTYATYTHCLVHRHEADKMGEFGMTGWANANFWGNAVVNSAGLADLPHGDLFEHTSKIVKETTDSDVQAWASRYGIVKDSKEYYDPRAVHILCQSNQSDTAERIAETELRVVLAHALQRAGFDCSVESILNARSGR